MLPSGPRTQPDGGSAVVSCFHNLAPLWAFQWGSQSRDQSHQILSLKEQCTQRPGQHVPKPEPQRSLSLTVSSAPSSAVLPPSTSLATVGRFAHCSDTSNLFNSCSSSSLLCHESRGYIRKLLHHSAFGLTQLLGRQTDQQNLSHIVKESVSRCFEAASLQSPGPPPQLKPRCTILSAIAPGTTATTVRTRPQDLSSLRASAPESCAP